MSGSRVEVTGIRLLRIVNEATEIHKGYDRESNFVMYDSWSWTKMKHIKTRCYTYPSWADPNSGILRRLLELKVIAEGVGINDRVFLSESTFLNLMYLLKKSDKFQRSIFSLGY